LDRQIAGGYTHRTREFQGLYSHYNYADLQRIVFSYIIFDQENNVITMNTIIRPSTKEDLPAIFTLFKEFSIFQKTPEKMHITLEQLIGDEQYFRCFVAVVDGQIIGYATYFFAYYSWTGRGTYLDDLYVQESHRKYGIGKQLLDKVIHHAKENNCKSVRWLVSRWNSNAIEFYKKMGAYMDDTEMTAVLPL